MATPESDVFKPLDDSIKDDQDQWPEFTLKNVKIKSQATGKAASLLSAHGGNLLRVEGILSDINPEHKDLMVNRKRSIRVDNVALYSFSQYDDGSFGFWAAGKSGWFEISSAAPKYQQIFSGMIEATGMFYYLADKYRNSRSKLTKEPIKVQDAHVKNIFNDYINSDYCKRCDNEDIREGFYGHRNFLMKSMLEGQEGLDWDKAPVLRHLKRKYKPDFDTQRSIVIGGPSVKDEDEEEDELEEIPATQPAHQNDKRTRSGRSQRGSTSIPETQLPDEEDGESISLATTPPRKGKRKSYLRPRSERSSKRFSGHDTRSTSLQEDTEMASGSDTDSPAEQVISELAKQVMNTETAPDVDSAMATQRAPMPTYYEPRGPGDTWTCPYDGCLHKIWDAHSQASVELMKAHFNDAHSGNVEELVNSERRPWAGVSHLLQRLNRFAAASSDPQGKLSGETGLPERIVKRY